MVPASGAYSWYCWVVVGGARSRQLPWYERARWLPTTPVVVRGRLAATAARQ